MGFTEGGRLLDNVVLGNVGHDGVVVVLLMVKASIITETAIDWVDFAGMLILSSPFCKLFSLPDGLLDVLFRWTLVDKDFNEDGFEAIALNVPEYLPLQFG